MIKKCKIMILNINYLGNKECKVSFLVKPEICFDTFQGYMILTQKVDYSLLKDFKKFGCWIENKYFELGRHYFIYNTPKDKLIFKNIKFDNRLKIGDCNSYNHKLIYRNQLEEVYLWKN